MQENKGIDNSRCEVVHVTTRYIWNALGDSLGHDLAVVHLIGESISLSVTQSKYQSRSRSLN